MAKQLSNVMSASDHPTLCLLSPSFHVVSLDPNSPRQLQISHLVPIGGILPLHPSELGQRNHRLGKLGDPLWVFATRKRHHLILVFHEIEAGNGSSRLHSQ